MGLVDPHAAEYPLCASCRNLDVPIQTEPCASCHRAFLKNAEKPGFSPKPATNYDKLRAMSVEEMSRWIWAVQSGIECESIVSTGGWLDWLRQEVSP